MIRKVITQVLADQSVTSAKLHNNVICDLPIINNIDAANDLVLVFDANTNSLAQSSLDSLPANIIACTGVTYTNNCISIGQDVSITSDVTFNDVTVSGSLLSDDVTASNVYICGDLTVTGTTTSVNSTTVDIADKNLNLACNATNATQADGGGINLTGASACIFYNSTHDTWNFNKSICATQLFGQVTDISNHFTCDVVECNDLYFTDTRARQSICGTGDITYTCATGEINVVTYKTANFNTDFATKFTCDLDECINLYYTDTRFDTRFTATTIGNLCDVDITTVAPTCGQALLYNDTTCKFSPGNVAAGGGGGSGISLGLAIALG